MVSCGSCGLWNIMDFNLGRLMLRMSSELLAKVAKRDRFEQMDWYHLHYVHSRGWMNGIMVRP